MTNPSVPKLLFLRFTRPNLPAFIRGHLSEQVKCLERQFSVVVDDQGGDYDELCDRHTPDLVIFETGVYVGARRMSNLASHRAIPRLGFIHCDAYCPSRKDAIADLADWGVSDFFTTSVALPVYTPEIAARCFVWPNFVDPTIYFDRRSEKVIPVLLTGSQAPHYPWRNRISRVVSPRFPTMVTPHFGWETSTHASRGQMLYGDDYARMLSASSIAPTCGTIAMEVVRKHLEIPACNACLVTEKTSALIAAGFQGDVNCVFADDVDVVEKIDWLLNSPDDLRRISSAGNKLVMELHTAAQRTEVWQWFCLQKMLKGTDRIVQARPFGPLTIAASAARTAPVLDDLAPTDRVLIQRADREARAGRDDLAEGLLLRCLNMVSNMAEPRLRLALMHLRQGDAEAALVRMRELLTRAYAMNSSMQPDPVEWGYFLLCLVATGRSRQALAHLKEYPLMQHVELTRVSRALQALQPKSDASGFHQPTTSNRVDEPHRASIHALTIQADEEWTRSVVAMLRACGRALEADLIADASDQSSSRPDRHEAIRAVGATDVGSALTSSSTASRRPIRLEPLDLRTPLRSAKRLLLRSARPVRDALQSCIRRSRTQEAGDPGLLGLKEMLHREPVTSAVCVGAARNSPLTMVFIDGLAKNDSATTLVLAHSSSQKLKKQDETGHQRFAQIEVEAVMPSIPMPNFPKAEATAPGRLSSFDLVAIDFNEVPQFELSLLQTPAAMFVLYGLSTRNGHDAHRMLSLAQGYGLVAFDALEGSGYAVFRRAPNGIVIAHDQSRPVLMELAT